VGEVAQTKRSKVTLTLKCSNNPKWVATSYSTRIYNSLEAIYVDGKVSTGVGWSNSGTDSSCLSANTTYVDSSQFISSFSK